MVMSKYKDCFDLAEKLPYFKVEDGKIHITIKDRIIDFHTHIGLSYFFSKPVDYMKETDTVNHEFPEKGIPIDMTVFSGINLRDQNRKQLFKNSLRTAYKAQEQNATHTIPNLLAEMDRYNVDRSIVLAVDMPFDSRLTEQYLAHKDVSERLTFFAYVNPINTKWKYRMKKYVESGAKGLKIHPYTMMCAPKHPRTMKVIKEWSQYNLPVMFHCGYCGIEPAFTRKWLEVEGYELPIKTFPETTFILGHAGSGFYKKAMRLAMKYPNVILDLNGQPPIHIKDIMKNVRPYQMVFGSDWPYYPIILPLSKVLIATEGESKMRSRILNGNAQQILDLL